MNANLTAIRVMKQAAAAPDRNDLSEQAERGQAVGRWLVDTRGHVPCTSPGEKSHQ